LSSPEKPQAGQRTDAKKRPQNGQVFSLSPTSRPQLSQKKRGFSFPFNFIYADFDLRPDFSEELSELTPLELGSLELDSLELTSLGLRSFEASPPESCFETESPLTELSGPFDEADFVSVLPEPLLLSVT
jgi:hypothetical protein